MIHTFTLHLGRDPRSQDELADALYKARCSDALFSIVNGQPMLEFARRRRSYGEAVRSAVADATGAGLRVLRVTKG